MFFYCGCNSTEKFPVNNDYKSTVAVFENLFLFKSATKQNVIIKVITYFCLSMKAVERQHLKICSAALY
jgi:hypothetical protein